MFTLTCKLAKAEIKKQDELDSIIQRIIASGYAAIARGALGAVCDIAGLPSTALTAKDMLAESPYYGDPEGDADRYMGDLFVKDRSLFFLAAVGARIEAYEIRSISAPSSIDQFCATVQEAAHNALDGRRLRGMEFSWADGAPGRHSRRQRIRRMQGGARLDEKPADYTPQDAERAALIAEKTRRTFLFSLAQSRGKMRRADTRDVSDTQIVTPLTEAGIIRREYLILCKKDLHTICTVSSLEKLTGDTEGMQCSECGRPLKDEQSQEIYALTATGKALLEKSKWMSIWVTECLKRAGLLPTDITWNASAAEDELDVIVSILGNRVFIELKDREFGLGDAYPFAFRINRYGGDYGVIVTTERIAEEAKKFLSEPTPGVERRRFILVEEETSIPSQLADIVHQVSQIAIRQFIGSIGERFAINMVAVVQAWMKLQESST